MFKKNETIEILIVNDPDRLSIRLSMNRSMDTFTVDESVCDSYGTKKTTDKGFI